MEPDFFQLFRMNQETFNTLLEKINHPDPNKLYHGGGVPVPGHLQLLMTLLWLGKGETFLSVSERFGVSLYAVLNCTERILDRLLTLINRYICWPTTPEEIQTIINQFEERCGFPGNCANLKMKSIYNLQTYVSGVIGAIDGTNIR